jgi:hypothetical protein
MLSNVGKEIQKMINNIPIDVAVNETTTTVVTNGGNVYRAGFINNRVQDTFCEVLTNENLVGHVIQVASTDDTTYILNAAGSVFEFKSGSNKCGSPVVHEVYSVAACGCGVDKAVSIAAGSSHVVILTEKGKVFGAGSNDAYQLVPQGQCRYDTATEIYITDTNIHDSDSCLTFTGTYSELDKPIIPSCKPKKKCETDWLKGKLCDAHIGYINYSPVKLECNDKTGIISVPLFGDVCYSGQVCVECNGCVSGSVTYSVTKIYIKCGCFKGKFTTASCNKCISEEINLSSTQQIILFEAATHCGSGANSNLCSPAGSNPLTGVAPIEGRCGDCAVLNLNISLDVLPEGFVQNSSLILSLAECRTVISVLCGPPIVDTEDRLEAMTTFDIDIPIDCSAPSFPEVEERLPQPCWVKIFAGFNISVLVDSCNRIYVLGSIHEIRNNRDLLRRPGLNDLFSQANTSISFPADQINCGDCGVNNGCIKYNDCPKSEFKTDFSKFGVHLSFPDSDCPDQKLTPCEFLKQIKKYNETTQCENSCEPCDGYIYINIAGDGHCPYGAPTAEPIGSVTLFNRKSAQKVASIGRADITEVRANVNTIVEFDLNKYCIDAMDQPLDKVIRLSFCNNGPNVNLYIDVDTSGGIKFTSGSKKVTVEFPLNSSTECQKFILNYGTVMDPAQLTNLRYVLALETTFPSPKYKNPFDTKLINTYVRGGDHIRFVSGNPKNIRLAVTADVPTLFRLNKRVIDIAVGQNNLTAVVGSLACPNEIWALGQNCFGELGIGSNETAVCWKNVNRCDFDSAVNAVFAGARVTFYITQKHSVYAAGSWKGFIRNNVPGRLKSVCDEWKIKQIAVAENHIVFLGADGCIFGMGDNSLGELGLRCTDCVPKPRPLEFFYDLNRKVAKKFCNNDGPGFCGPSVCGPPPCGDKRPKCPPKDRCEDDRKCGPERSGRYQPNYRVGPRGRY